MYVRIPLWTACHLTAAQEQTDGELCVNTHGHMRPDSSSWMPDICNAAGAALIEAKIPDAIRGHVVMPPIGPSPRLGKPYSVQNHSNLKDAAAKSAR